MAYTTPYTFTGSTTLDPAKLDSNFSALASKLNAGLTEANMSSATRFSNTFLTNKHYNFVLSFNVNSVQHAAASAGGQIGIVGIPDPGSTDTYTIVGYDWYCDDVGDQTGQFTLIWSKYVGGSSTTITTLASNVTMTAQSGANNTLGAASALLGTDITLSASEERRILLNVGATKGTGLMSAGNQFLNINLYLKRKNGLRA